ncbi:hypothetical protein KI387_012537 [Taxus chinensis]|uniref:Scarecrow-like protein 4 n=1 Tax=Taxus chinensis TaxID=29808 RepID=A0AA38FCD1_TAXCH|nr:hypothetical protein KI387_012537 [Taxus chinensis]
MAYMCAENGNLMAIAQQLVQQQQQQHHQHQVYSNHPSGYFGTAGASMGMSTSMGMNPWLVGPASGGAWHEGSSGGLSFSAGLCPDVMGDLCSTTTATTSYLSEPSSVLDLSRASMLFSPMDHFHDFSHHLPDGSMHLKPHHQMPLIETPSGALFNGDVLVKKERPPMKESGGVFRLPELQTFGGFDSPVNVVGPDVCPEWMDCLMTDLQPEPEGNNNNNSITFDSNPCESTESSELPSGGYQDAWQGEFGILGEAFGSQKQQAFCDHTTAELLCSSPSADLLSAASSELLSSSKSAALQEQYSGAVAAVAAAGGHEFQPPLHRLPNVQSSSPMQLKREPTFSPQKWQGKDALKTKRDEDSKPEADLLEQHQHGPSSHLVQSLLDCAKIVDAEPERAAQSISHLQTIASSQGDPTERVVSYFANALSKRFSKGSNQNPQAESCRELEESTLAYKALNDACPYSKFAHLTANQAILEVMDTAEKIHIIDFGIAQGIQWAAILQAFATRPGGKPRKIKITGIPAPTLGLNPTASLLATGKRLKEFASLLELDFDFCPIPNHLSDVELSMLKIEEDECVAVNFMLQLYNLLGESSETLMKTLKLAHALSPRVVTLGEYEANLNACGFQVRFRNALQYYSAIFNSMEPSMKRDCHERLNVEKFFFGEKITGIVAYEGAERKIRLEGRDQWRMLMESAGFKCSNLSHYAMSQARILLWNYCDRYSLVESPGFLSLAWQERPLLTVSAWCCC